MHKRQHRTLEREGLVADEVVVYCDKCNKCWEAVRFRGRKSYHHKYLYYDDFPTYNRKRVKCHKCSGKKMKSKKLDGMIFWQEIVKS